jgi:translation initiation factor 2B subunit (eIF-2B alpha/beta/delta family)
VEFVFPPAGLPGSNDEYTIYGFNLPGGQPAGLQSGGRPLEQLKVRIAIPGDILGRMVFSERLEAYQFALDGVEYRVAGPQGPSNPVFVTAATAPVLQEQENNTPQTAQKLVPPVEVAGQFYPQRDIDWYAIDAKAGDVFWIEIWSHRLGLPTDPTLVIQRVARTEDGKEQITLVATVDDVDQRYGGREFDQRSYDPAYRFTAPADGTYRILVREGYSQLHNEPRLVYRLSIRKPEPDFRLVAVPIDVSGAILMRKGGREVVRVIAARRDGFDGPITISAAGLPAGVTAPEVTLGPATNFTSLILTADPGAAAGSGSLQITGKSTVAGKELVRVARAGMSLDALQFNQPTAEIPSTRSRLVDYIPVTVSAGEVARLQIALGDGKVIETARGGVLKIPYTVTRQEGAAGTLTGFPVGLPPNIGLPQVPMGGNNAGDFELRLQANTPPGTYTFYLAGSAQGVNYSRNPEAAAQAKERQDQLAKAVTDTQQKLQLAQQAAQQAATALTTATNEMATATQAKTTADQLAATTAAAQKAAMETLAALMKQSAAAPTDAALKDKVTAQQKEVDEATKKATAAADAAKVADTKLTEATTKQKLAQEAKQKADKAQQDAQALTQLAQQEKQRADQRAQQLQQQAAMRGYNVNIPSTPLTIKIAEYPIKASGTPDKLAVKQGAMLDLPFKVERLFGFAAEVTTQLVLPPGVAGLQAANATLPANQTDGKLVVMAQPNATPGVHNVIVRMTLNFNGQGLTMDQTVALTVEKVEPAAK